MVKGGRIEARAIVLEFNYRRLIFAGAALCLPATLLHAALPTEPDLVGPTSLVGQLLIASPELHQPIFDHAVILLAQHSHDGAFGIIINRPLAVKPIAALLKAFGADSGDITDSVRIFVGGPVELAAGFVLHSTDYRLPETLDIDGRVALTSAPEVLRDIGLRKGPQKSLVAFGYAGWAPLQLEDELKHGVWMTLPEDLALVFDDDRAQVWDDALARQKTRH